MKLSIFSLNLKGFSDWENRFPKIIKILMDKNPDIILFQEVRFNPKGKERTALDIINEELWYPYKQYAKCFNFAEDYGKWILINKETGKPDFIEEWLGILSKTLFSSSIIDLPIQKGSDRWPRIALQCDFDFFSLVNIHYSPSSSVSIQWNETPKKDIIIWDFNMKPLQIKEVQWKYNSSYDFKEYISYPSEGNTFDYCLLKDWKFLNIEIFDEWISDHIWLYYEIEI